jgi:branched-chain amino acid transport system permease protein
MLGVSVTDLTTMALMVSLVAGQNFLVGRAKLVTFSHAAFYGLGAYTTAVLNRQFDSGFLVTVVAAGLVAAFGGVVIGLPAFRTAGAYLAMVTWALAVIVQTLFANLAITGGPFGIGPLKAPEVFRLSLGDLHVVAALAWLVAGGTVGTLALLTHSRIGWAIRTLGADDRVAQSLGVSRAYVLLAFILTAALAGIAGSVYAYFITYIYADPFSIDLSILLLVAAIVGGLGSISGSIVGTVLILSIRNGLRGYPFASDILFGLALILIIHLRPSGLLTMQHERRFVGWLVRPLRSRRSMPAAR